MAVRVSVMTVMRPRERDPACHVYCLVAYYGIQRCFEPKIAVVIRILDGLIIMQAGRQLHNKAHSPRFGEKFYLGPAFLLPQF